MDVCKMNTFKPKTMEELVNFIDAVKEIEKEESISIPIKAIYHDDEGLSYERHIHLIDNEYHVHDSHY